MSEEPSLIENPLYRLKIEWIDGGRLEFLSSPYSKEEIADALDSLHIAMVAGKASVLLEKLGVVVATASVMCATAVENARYE